MTNYIGKLYNVTTYGCQMNVHESEKIKGMLSELGMIETSDIEKSDVVVFNTCCVREGAEDRAYNNIIALKKWKKESTDKIIVLCGCMPQQKNGKYNFKRQLPIVDIVLGTHNINTLKEKLIDFAENKKSRAEQTARQNL